MDKPDLTYKQVEMPSNRWCASGHIAPEEFKTEENGEPKPTRFFHVIGNGINNIYCEPCLIVANYLSRQNKKKKV